MDKQLVKKKIVEFEYYENGYNRLSGADVKVVNLYVGKKKATADVILSDGDIKTRVNSCEYPLVELGL
jgi:hypothetical protein